jgi:hypothetical protein
LSELVGILDRLHAVQALLIRSIWTLATSALLNRSHSSPVSL